jgi:hypothetical protein
LEKILLKTFDCLVRVLILKRSLKVVSWLLIDASEFSDHPLACSREVDEFQLRAVPYAEAQLAVL